MLEDWINVVEVNIDLEDVGKVGLIVWREIGGGEWGFFFLVFRSCVG